MCITYQKSSPSSTRMPLTPPLCVRPPSRAFAVRICGTRLPCAWGCGGAPASVSTSSAGCVAGNGYCTCASWCGVERGVLAELEEPFFDFRRAFSVLAEVDLLATELVERS